MRRLMMLCCLAAALAAGCVMKDDIVVLDERIFRLEQRQKEMENRLSNLSGTEERIESILSEAERKNRQEVQTLRSQLAEVRAMNNQLREDLQELTGRIEESEFRLRQRSDGKQQAGERFHRQLERIDAAAAENTDRIRRLEQYLSLEKDRTPPPAEAPPAEAPDEAQLYSLAKEAFDSGKFGQARASFQDLLKRFPDSAQADNAQFWIGESYYHEKWYEKAILEYQKVIEQYPEGNKLPAALLKQGFAFDQLGDAANARLILKELVRKHPDSNEASIARDKLQKLN